MAETRTCKGCGGPLEPNKGPGRERIWCSERCRKDQYRRPCPECGRMMHGDDGLNGSRSPTVCAPCAARHGWEAQKSGWDEQQEMVEGLWALGYTYREIEEELGREPGRKAAKSSIARWRSRGYDLPYRRPEAIAWGKQLAEKRHGNTKAAPRS